MHARDAASSPDRGNADRAPARSTPGTRAPQYSAMSLLGLQASVGNAAVVQMLRQAGHPWAQEQHRHGAGCGHQSASPTSAPVQRSVVHGMLSSGGQPLDESTRTDMEARLGADFSDVRVHTGAAARVSAAEMGGRAYTSGSHVVIGDGGADRHTLAHELTHVIQQRHGPVAGTDNGSGLKVSDPSDRFEREAEATATRALSGPAAGERTAVPAQRVAAANVPVAGTAVQRVVIPGRPHVDYGPLSAGGTGTKMEAWLYPNQLDQGSSPSVQPAWWPPRGTPIGNWFSMYMVQGHLLNDKLGGPGNTLFNLTPLVRQANSQHHAKIERHLKAAVLTQGCIAQYHVTADYGTPPTSAHMGMQPNSQEAWDFDNTYRQLIPGEIRAEYTLWNANGKRQLGGDAWIIENNNL